MFPCCHANPPFGYRALGVGADAGDSGRRSVIGSAPTLRRNTTMPIEVGGRRSQLSPLEPAMVPQATEIRSLSRQANNNNGAAWPAQVRNFVYTYSILICHITQETNTSD